MTDVTAAHSVALVLATYYVAYTAARLHGPFGLAERFRHAVYRRAGYVRKGGVWQGAPGRRASVDAPGDDWLTAGVQCPACVAPWAALVLVAMAQTTAGAWVVGWLAVAGGASVVHLALSGHGTPVSRQ